ncbi:unnamed protein product [Cuscuta epithymum]|uniref:SnoaL-like domain-containing protein n=1 Tax=Cuscuta epithymum TaxID=186058 RepID=A0AAV0ETT7_9ASTE|nr:unnamed protein product [Cuscuta epithymum]
MIMSPCLSLPRLPSKDFLSTAATGYFLPTARSSVVIRPVAKSVGQSCNPKAVLAHASSRSSAPTLSIATLESASSVVRKFYSGINSRDLAAVESLIAENCVYEDLIFPQPFVGRKAILDFFEKFIYSVGHDLQFVIDDISEEDSSAVGVTWHLEWKGRHFPFSKGCSFYRLDAIDGQRQIQYGRDGVEPTFKPGETALVAIRGVAWLLQQFPKMAELL